MTTALLLVVALAPAAPVPAELKAGRQLLETAWKDLESHDPHTVVRAAVVFANHPGTPAFLAKKLTPVQATKAQLKDWLADLDDDDEKTWKPAFESLKYHDPLIGLTLEEQIEIVDSCAGRRRLASIHYGSEYTTFQGETHIELAVVRDDRGASIRLTHHCTTTEGLTQINTSIGVGEVATLESVAWQRAALAATILHRTPTRTGRAALELLATGHPDALPTRTAKRLLAADEFVGPVRSDFDDSWLKLQRYASHDAAHAVLALIDHPHATRRMKEKLPAIKATKEQVTEWLTALDSKDDEVWQPAFEKLLYFRPLIALSVKEQIDIVKTDRGRTALYQLYASDWEVPQQIKPPAKAELLFQNDFLMLVGENHGEGIQIEPLAVVNRPYWMRAGLAVVALEQIGTAEAQGVLKQLADGHPDIDPTRGAKAALARLK